LIREKGDFSSMKRQVFTTLLIMTTASILPMAVYAEIPPQMVAGDKAASSERASLARQFLSKVARKFEEADRQRHYAQDPLAAELASFNNGEELFLQIKLANSYELDAPVLSRVKDGALYISFRDFLLSVQFPIDVNMSQGTAKGLYIKDKPFSLNVADRLVVRNGKEIPFSSTVIVEDNDVFVQADELANWFDIKLEPKLGQLALEVKSSDKLPIQTRLERKNQGPGHKQADPVYPRLPEDNLTRDYPLVDVATTMSYTKQGDARRRSSDDPFQANAFIKTSGNLAGGTLSTNTSLDKEEHLTNFRATFSEQSLEPTLLGPLNARKYELGDVYSPLVQLRTSSYSGVGARVTNVSPNRSTLSPSTDIRGTAFPGWDIELYRDDRLLDVVTVGEDGTYEFSNIDLFSQNNDFRVVKYGPQGEREEEEVLIPVDRNRISNREAAYDVSVVSQEKQLYRKYDNKSENKGTAAVVARYEQPVGENSAVTLGLESGAISGERLSVAHAGLITGVGGALINLDAAIDDNAETAAQLVARRDMGKHRLRFDTRINSDKYGITEEENEVANILTSKVSLNGPLNLNLGSMNYNTEASYGLNPDGDPSYGLRAGITARLINRLTVGQQFAFNSQPGKDDTINSLTTLTGSYGRNRLRLASNYQIEPEAELKDVTARLTRPVAQDLDFALDVRHLPEPKLTEGKAQLNWRAGWADISPSISYNTDKEAIAMLNTRFGLARDPLSKDIKTFQDSIANNGGISAFVYLDKNGDNIFNEGDEPIQDAIVRAPQNGGEEITDEKGYAFFTQLINMRPTDIYVDNGSLADPFWVSSYDGFSIVPREGNIVSIEFPVHIGGEIDGTVYARIAEGSTQAMRGISISLYDLKGKKVRSTVSESDGFYLLDKVPPGRYMLVVDNKNFDGPYARPKPQPILIKSTGSTIAANNIFLQQYGADVPVTFYANAEDLKIDPSTLHGRSLFLNLGSYKSRLSMGLAWLKIRKQFNRELGNMEIMELPSETNPDKTQFYTLRVLAYSDDMTEAYNKCKVLTSNGQTCGVEVVPEQMPKRIATKE
jgi:hypothetical protein